MEKKNTEGEKNMANVNITEADSSVVLDLRMWAGADNESTDWLQSPIGSNSAAGALNLLVVDIKITSASSATTFDLTDTGITGVDGTTAVTVLGLINNSGGFEIPADIRVSGATVLFTSPSGTNTDVMRLSLLYR